ncbi:PaaI family thioesterase [Gallaecimonas xiamenensis]|uniref:Thioesterase n=1 Tax=Gallaecimonas xiamenensis 3-C-1 TaxID=745411 RepID=K2J2W1_9GAMM|nr:PaaI family thioesterase [Gallaecimonas xiamenensis]EKE69448.1 thioesterase [Gallaecimonas xiamenensis 3-C-1]
MEITLEVGKEILAQQSFSRLLGTELVKFEKGYAELILEIKEDLKQNNGFAHGGVVSYMADNCITFAGASVLGACVTSEYKINYVRPSIGERLIAKAKVLHAGNRQSTCECKVFVLENDKEKLVAVALGTISKIQAP